MDRNSGNDDRRTEARRQVTPKGEVIVEVPFTEAQARALLTLDFGFGCTREIADTVAGARALLKASLDYAVARAKRPVAVEIDYECRDIGYGVESGIARGVWGERDWTGKREFLQADGPTLYLFDDEVYDEVMDPDVTHKRRQGE